MTRPPSVLVIDDDAGIQQLLETLLQRSGFGVEIVGNGVDAVRRLKTSHCSVILLDLMLPKMTGFEVLTEMKALHPHLLKRTVVLTAVSDATLKEFTDEALVWKLIRKPFDVNGLVETVASCAAQSDPPAPVEQSGRKSL
jgi:CheY-like chemotaxis protein